MAPPGKRKVSIILIAARLIVAAGLLMVAYYYGTDFFTYVKQRQLRAKWSELAKAASSRPVNPPKERLPKGEIFGRLIIPKLGLDVIVLEGTDITTLRSGPGHIRSTPPPWTSGNTAISGHRTTFGAPFRFLNRLAAGDKIVLETARGAFSYLVSGSAVVRPTDVAVIGQQFRNRLTLTTCDPPGTAVRRLAVWAKKR